MTINRGTTFRLDPETRTLLDAFAEQTRRSANASVNLLLLRALNEAARAGEFQPPAAKKSKAA